MCLSAVLRTGNSDSLSHSGFLINIKPARVFFFYVRWEVEVVGIPGAFELPPEHLCLFWAEARLRLSSQHAQLVTGGGWGGGGGLGAALPVRPN